MAMSQEPGLFGRIKRGAATAAPAAGAVVGGALGLPGGPITAAGGAGLGAAAGSYLGQMIYPEQEMTELLAQEDDPIKRQLIMAQRPVEEAAWEVGGAGAGTLIKPVAKMAGKGLRAIGEAGAPTLKPDFEELIQAGKRLGVEPTPGQVTDSKLIQNLESSLEQSPSLMARPVRKHREQIEKTLQEATENLTEHGTTATDFEVGQGVKRELTDRVEEMRSPIREAYDDIADQMLDTPVDENVLDDVMLELTTDPLFETKMGQNTLTQIYDNFIDGIQNLDQLKRVRTQLGQSLSGTASDLERQYIGRVYDSLTEVRRRTIDAMGKGKKTFASKVKAADEAHKNLMQKLNSVKKLMGQKVDFKSPGEFVRKLDDMIETRVTDKFFDMSRIEELRKFKELFPDQFERVRARKVQQLLDRSRVKQRTTLDPRTLVRHYNGLQREVKDLLFDKPAQSSIENMSIFIKNMPTKIGPSGTPQGMQYLKFGSWLTEIRDAMRMLAYKGLKASGNIYNLPSEFMFQRAAELQSEATPSVMAHVMGVPLVKGEKEYEFYIDPADHAAYINDIRNDDDLTNIEKARLMHLANKKGIGIRKEEFSSEAPPEQRFTPMDQISLESVADKLRGGQ